MHFTDDGMALPQGKSSQLRQVSIARSQQQLRPASKILEHAPQTSKFDHVG